MVGSAASPATRISDAPQNPACERQEHSQPHRGHTVSPSHISPWPSLMKISLTRDNGLERRREFAHRLGFGH